MWDFVNEEASSRCEDPDVQAVLFCFSFSVLRFVFGETMQPSVFLCLLIFVFFSCLVRAVMACGACSSCNPAKCQGGGEVVNAK